MGIQPSRALFLLLTSVIISTAFLTGCSEVGIKQQPTVTAMVQVSYQPNGTAFRANHEDVQQYEILRATQAQLIKSSFVLTAALRKPEIVSLDIVQREKADPIQWLKDNLKVTFPADSEIMQISLESDRPEQAAKLVNAVVDAYLSEVTERDRNVKAQEMAELEEIMTAKQKEFRLRRMALKQLAEELGMVDSDTLAMHRQLATQKLVLYQKQLLHEKSNARKLNSEIAVAEAALARMEKKQKAIMPNNGDSTPQVTLRNIAEEMSHLVNQLGQVVSKLSNVELSQQLQNDLAIVHNQVIAWQKLLNSQLTDLRKAELRDKIADLTVRIELNNDTVKELEKEIKSQEKQLENEGLASVEVEMRRAELERLGKMIEKISDKREALKMEAKSQPRIRLLQRAVPPL